MAIETKWKEKNITIMFCLGPLEKSFAQESEVGWPGHLSQVVNIWQWTVRSAGLKNLICYSIFGIYFAFSIHFLLFYFFVCWMV